MPIQMRCHCGQEMITQDQHAGRTVKCPGCAKLLLVPDPYAAQKQELAEELRPDAGFLDEVPGALEFPPEKPSDKSAPRPGSSRADDFAIQAPLPSLELPSQSRSEVPEIDPEELDDDDLFSDNSEAVVETDVQIETGDDLELDSQPALPSPPPLPSQITTNPAKTNSTDEGDWAGHVDVRVKKHKGRKRRRRPRDPDELGKFVRMSRLYRGLSLLLMMAIGWMVIMTLNVFFSVFGGFSVAANEGDGAAGLRITLALIRTGGWLIASSFGMAGSIMCCWAPVKSRLKTFAVSAAAFLGVGLFLNFISLMTILATRDINYVVIAFICEFIASVLGLIAVILILLNFRRLAKYLEDGGSDSEAYYLITAWPVVHYFVPILLMCGLLVLARFSIFLSLAFIICAFVGWLNHWVKVLIRLLNLIGTLRAIIEYRYL